MEHIIHLLIEFKYLILFPFAIVEGPIIAVIAGFLCTSNFLNPLLVYPVIVLGDIIGDSICYSVGRWGTPKFLKNIFNHFTVTKKKIVSAKIFFDANPAKTISLSKILLGIGVAGIYLAGNAKVPYSKFIRICLATSAIQYMVYLCIGILFGHAYIQINQYLNYFATVTVMAAIAIILFLLIKSLVKKI